MSMSVVKTDVIKHSAAIQISNDVSLLQRRAWNVLLAYAFDGLMEKEEHYINLKDLYSQLEYNSNDINHIKELLKNIVSINVEWNILRKDGKQEWGVVSLLSEVEICDGVLKYSFAPGLRKKLYNPSMYAKLNLSLQNKFTSKYSLGLYEIFIDYFDLQRGQGETPWIEIGEFRKLMGLKDNEYSRYTDLNHYIIKKSIKEINELTDLHIDILTKKIKRSISALKFIIQKKEGNIAVISNDSYDFLIVEPELVTVLVNEFSVDSKTAQKLVAEYNETQIKANIDYVKSSKKKINNLAGFIVDAIKNNWTSKSPLKATETKSENSSANRQELKDLIMKHVYSERKNRMNQIFAALPDNDQEKYRNVFESKVINGEFNQFISRSFNMKRFDGVGVKLEFNNYLMEQLLDPIELDIQAYLEKNNITMTMEDFNG
jgi:plasmid replication initiation protein